MKICVLVLALLAWIRAHWHNIPFAIEPLLKTVGKGMKNN